MTTDFPLHLNSQYRDQITLWSGSDQEDKLIKNLSDQKSRAILESQGWDIPGCITYDFNSHGFRDDQFDSRICSLAMGCSFTQGVGVDVDNTWPRVLSKILGHHVWNLGIGGCALDTVVRLACYYLDFLKPKMLFLLTPPPWRIEYAVSDTDFDVLLPNTHKSDSDDFIKSWFAFDPNSRWNKKKNLLCIEYLCKQKNIPLFILDTQNHGNDFLARDLVHPGRAYHGNIAQMFFDCTKK